MDAVRAADDRRVLELDRARAQHARQLNDARADLCRGLAQLERLRGVDDVGGGEPEVQPARGVRVRDVLGHRRRKGNHIVPDLSLDRVDARHGKIAAIADGIRRSLRDDAGAREHL